MPFSMCLRAGLPCLFAVLEICSLVDTEANVSMFKIGIDGRKEESSIHVIQIREVQVHIQRCVFKGQKITAPISYVSIIRRPYYHL